MQWMSVCVLGLLVMRYGSARYVDEQVEQYDLRGLEDPEPEPVTEETPLEEEDSCEDFPPASCIRHFSPLPGNLQRSPFALKTKSEFITICEAYKKAMQCFNEFSLRCHPDQRQARQFIEQMSALLQQCESPQVQQDVVAALDCGRRMGPVHERCIRETRFIPQLKDLSSERMLIGDENSIRDLCCGMRYHKACYMDQVADRCGQPALESNQRLEQLIMRGFNCDSYSTSDCPTIRL